MLLPSKSLASDADASSRTGFSGNATMLNGSREITRIVLEDTDQTVFASEERNRLIFWFMAGTAEHVQRRTSHRINCNTTSHSGVKS